MGLLYYADYHSDCEKAITDDDLCYLCIKIRDFCAKEFKYIQTHVYDSVDAEINDLKRRLYEIPVFDGVKEPLNAECFGYWAYIIQRLGLLKYGIKPIEVKDDDNDEYGFDVDDDGKLDWAPFGDTNAEFSYYEKGLEHFL